MGVSARRISLLLVLVAILGGCVKVGSAPTGSSLVEPSGDPAATLASDTTPPAATPKPQPTATAGATTAGSDGTPEPTATPDDGAQVVEVSLSDSLTIDPGKMTVTAGVPVRFVVTNDGALDHDFFIGTDKEIQTRSGGDGEPGPDRFIAVPPGKTVELLYTFDDPGKLIAACTIAGHYSGGMKANITVKAP